MKRFEVDTGDGWTILWMQLMSRIIHLKITHFRLHSLVVAIVQSLSHTWLFATPWTKAHQAFLSFTISLSLFKFISIELAMLSNHLILCRPLLPLPSIFPRIKVFSSELARPIRWPKYWNLSFSISPSNEYSGLISFRADWFDLLVVQGTLALLRVLLNPGCCSTIKKLISSTSSSSPGIPFNFQLNWELVHLNDIMYLV